MDDINVTVASSNELTLTNEIINENVNNSNCINKKDNRIITNSSLTKVEIYENSENNIKQRVIWLDITKAFLIIFVVYSHVIGPPYKNLKKLSGYLFLVHLPWFFIVSGYLYKEKQLIKGIIHRAKRLLIPYFLYYYVIAIPQIIYYYNKKVEKDKAIYLKNSIKALILGGKSIGIFRCGSLWYIPVSFFSTIIFNFIEKYIKNEVLNFIIYLFLWGLSHYLAIYYPSFFCKNGNTPFLWDVSIITSCYLCLGKKIKPLLFKKKYVILSLFLLFTFQYLHYMNILPHLKKYGFELWNHNYKYPIFDLFVPSCFFVVLTYISDLIGKIKFINYLNDLGKYTIPIMALHDILKFFLRNIITNNLLMGFIIIIIPYLIGKLMIGKFKILKKYML